MYVEAARAIAATQQLVSFCAAIFDAIAKTQRMAKQKFRTTRPGGFSGAKAYIRYVEVLKKRRNAVGRTFCDAIFVGLDKKEGVWRGATRRLSPSILARLL